MAGARARTAFRMVRPAFSRHATANARGRDSASCLVSVAASASAVPSSSARFEPVLKCRTSPNDARIAIAVKGTSVMNV